MESTIHIYTDGACSGNPGPGGWAAVILFPDGRLLELGGGERPTTNNRMEMAAAIAALAAVQEHAGPVKLYTDSGLLVNGIKAWIHAWKKKDWLTAGGKPVVNRDLWERLDALAAARRGRLAWAHVKGHAGQKVNERCDAIAVAFSKGLRPKLYEGPAAGCGYSLLPPGEEHLHAPAGKSSSGKSSGSGSKKGGYYLSFVGGAVHRDGTWDACKARVHGAPNARFKKVSSPDEEKAALELWGAAR